MSQLAIENIEYLTFEGGGAMGAAYLGALCALQDIDGENENWLFPGLREQDEYKNDTKIGGEGDINGVVKGVSGSSMGAIFGLCTAMGYTAEQINARLITDRIFTLLSSEEL